MWDDGLVYRGERIVNYCTKHQTSFADIEVEHKNEKGKLWQIAYPTLDKIGEIVVATTRPETMLGDVAVAVHPDDERYKHLIGTQILEPGLYYPRWGGVRWEHMVGSTAWRSSTSSRSIRT